MLRKLKSILSSMATWEQTCSDCMDASNDGHHGTRCKRKRLRAKGRFRRFRSMGIALTASLLMLCTCATVAFAGTDGFIEPIFLQRKTVLSGQDRYRPNTNNYPYDQGGVNSIGFDSLYGGSRHSFTVYYGEIPYALKDDLPYRYFNGDSINGQSRPFSNNGWGVDDIQDDSKDPHLWAMTQDAGGALGFLQGLGVSILGALYDLTNMIVGWIISMKSIDMGAILELIDDGAGSFVNILRSIFLVNPDTGMLSPVLLFSLVMYIIGMVCMSFKSFRGDMSVRLVVREFSMLLAALVIAGLFFNPTNPGKIANIGIDFATAVSNDLITSSLGEEGMIFMYETGVSSSTVDQSSTQKGLLSKIYIDSVIESQFGVSVDKLDIVDQDGNSDFGDLAQVDAAMVKTFGSGADRYSMRVVTGQSDVSRSINNLGYYWYAANSNVDIYNGKSGSQPAYGAGSDGVELKHGDSNRVLYVIDFLSAIREEAGEGSEVANKVDTIMQSFVHPKYGTASLRIFMAFVQNVALCVALFQLGIFCLIGEAIIIMGSFCMVVMPALLLFQGSRDVARRMMWSYLLAFMRYIIGSALFNAVIVVAVMLSAGGVGGMFVSIIVCLLMAKFAPQLLAEINSYIARHWGSHEIGAINRFYSSHHQRHGRWNRGRKRFNRFGRKRKPAVGNNPATSGAQGNSGEAGGQAGAAGAAAGARQSQGQDQQGEPEVFDSWQGQGQHGDQTGSRRQGQDPNAPDNEGEAPGQSYTPWPKRQEDVDDAVEGTVRRHAEDDQRSLDDGVDSDQSVGKRQTEQQTVSGQSSVDQQWMDRRFSEFEADNEDMVDQWMDERFEERLEDTLVDQGFQRGLEGRGLKLGASGVEVAAGIAGAVVAKDQNGSSAVAGSKGPVSGGVDAQTVDDRYSQSSEGDPDQRAGHFKLGQQLQQQQRFKIAGQGATPVQSQYQASGGGQRPKMDRSEREMMKALESGDAQGITSDGRVIGGRFNGQQASQQVIERYRHSEDTEWQDQQRKQRLKMGAQSAVETVTRGKIKLGQQQAQGQAQTQQPQVPQQRTPQGREAQSVGCQQRQMQSQRQEPRAGSQQQQQQQARDPRRVEPQIRLHGADDPYGSVQSAVRDVNSGPQAQAQQREVDQRQRPLGGLFGGRKRGTKSVSDESLDPLGVPTPPEQERGHGPRGGVPPMGGGDMADNGE